MNSIRLAFIFLNALIGIIYCSVIVRIQDQDKIYPPALVRDNFGCDAIIKSCGKNGGCCDLHDACYKKHRCTALSWFHLCKSNFIFLHFYLLFLLF